jgi:hypothetical protein
MISSWQSDVLRLDFVCRLILGTCFTFSRARRSPAFCFVGSITISKEMRAPLVPQQSTSALWGALSFAFWVPPRHLGEQMYLSQLTIIGFTGQGPNCVTHQTGLPRSLCPSPRRNRGKTTMTTGRVARNGILLSHSANWRSPSKHSRKDHTSWCRARFAPENTRRTAPSSG